MGVGCFRTGPMSGDMQAGNLEVWWYGGCCIVDTIGCCDYNCSIDVQRDERDSAGPPAWKQYARKDKALGKQAEATLEMIWSKTEWLTEEHIQGMWDNHRVRRDVVIDWFMKKRRESKKRQGGP